MGELRKLALITTACVATAVSLPTLIRTVSPAYQRIDGCWVRSSESETVVEVYGPEAGLYGYRLVDEGNNGLDFRETTTFGTRGLAPVIVKSHPTEKDRQLYDKIRKKLSRETE